MTRIVIAIHGEENVIAIDVADSADFINKFLADAYTELWNNKIPIIRLRSSANDYYHFNLNNVDYIKVIG